MHNQQDSSDILDQLLRETVSDTAQWNNNNQKHDIPVVIVENDQSNHTDSFINNLGNSLGLTIPPPRSRSNSIASSHHSYNAVDDCLSDFGSDYGAMSPFPGSTVVQIPSPWIREINSPSQLSINEPMSSLSQAGGSPHSPYPENGNFGGNIPQIDIQHLDFLDFYNQQYGEMPPASPSFGNINLNSSLSTESMSQMKSPEQTLPIPPSFPQAHSTMTTTLPSGKFWNTVKQNDQTLYQCPWPACNKSYYF